MRQYKGQLSPFFSEPEENLYGLVRDALRAASQMWYQRPHWTQEPTKEMLEREEQIIKECEAAYDKLDEIAAKIYKFLTGKSPK